MRQSVSALLLAMVTDLSHRDDGSGQLEIEKLEKEKFEAEKEKVCSFIVHVITLITYSLLIQRRKGFRGFLGIPLSVEIHY